MVPGLLRWCRVSREAGYSRCRNVGACSFTFGFGKFPGGFPGTRDFEQTTQYGEPAPSIDELGELSISQRQFVLRRFATNPTQKSVVRFFDRLDEL